MTSSDVDLVACTGECGGSLLACLARPGCSFGLLKTAILTTYSFTSFTCRYSIRLSVPGDNYATTQE